MGTGDPLRYCHRDTFIFLIRQYRQALLIYAIKFYPQYLQISFLI